LAASPCDQRGGVERPNFCASAAFSCKIRSVKDLQNANCFDSRRADPRVHSSCRAPDIPARIFRNPFPARRPLRAGFFVGSEDRRDAARRLQTLGRSRHRWDRARACEGRDLVGGSALLTSINAKAFPPCTRLIELLSRPIAAFPNNKTVDRDRDNNDGHPVLPFEAQKIEMPNQKLHYTRPIFGQA
jgi:hypothetical protein